LAQGVEGGGKKNRGLRRGVDGHIVRWVGDAIEPWSRRRAQSENLIALLKDVVRACEAALDVAEAQLLLIIDVVIGEPCSFG